MANSQITEEELQRSVVLSEEDADLDDEDPASAMALDTAAPQDPARPPHAQPSCNDQNIHHVSRGEEDDDDDEELSQVPDDEIESQPPREDSSSVDDGHDDNDDYSEDDAEGDHDEDMDIADVSNIIPRSTRAAAGASAEDDDAEEEAGGDVMEGDEDEEEAEDAEGVGAVKIKPGETDDDDSDSEISLPSASSDHESAAEWQDAVENGDDDDDDDSEAADSSVCMFCKKDEDNDPAEEFEAYLACAGCTEHAHQQCARDADALISDADSTDWKCPDCAADTMSSLETKPPQESFAATSIEDKDADEEMGDGDITLTSGRRTSARRTTRDLSPTQAGEVKPGSQSTSEDDPMDGSRVLRKRKTSSPELDDDVISVRKRRRNPTSGEPILEDAPPASDSQDALSSVRARSARSSRLKAAFTTDLCTIIKRSRFSFVISMSVDPSQLSSILSQDPKTTRKRSTRTTTSRPSRNATTASSTTTAATVAATTNPTNAAPSTSSRAATTANTEAAAIVPVFASSYSQPFYSLYDKETDELKGKPYGGILTEEQADTTKTLPTKDDRRRFDEAKQKAEEEWRNRLLAMQAESDHPVKKSRKTQGPASQIECIEMGGWEIDTWYAAPYPEEYSRNRVLFICEFCLKYMNSDYVAWRHKLKCPAKHPPGDEIYRHGSISFFEVDGRKNPVYCQNLCLLAKLFLGSKTLYYDVEPFLFYVLCEFDDLGYHFVGYFSKEKRASSQNNVSCILTLPIHQRKGYGNLLIDFSYLLTRVEEKTGSPEKPLSDMGLVSYRNYWRLIMSKYLINHLPDDKTHKTGLSVRKISNDTGMVPDDVISALEGLRCLVRDPVTHTYAFRVDLPYCRQYLEKWEAKGYVSLRPDVLTWTPYVMGRSNATNFELGPALNTIAPREEEEDSKAVQVLAETGIASGDFAAASQIMKKAAISDEATVLESTEPNDHLMVASGVDIALHGSDKEIASSREHTQGKTAGSSAGAAAAADKNAWQKPYEEIPVGRFQVFPATNHRRPGPARIPTSSAVRPSLPRVPATLPRPKPKPRRPTTTSGGSNSARKAAPPKKPSSAKRKTGGTGRGPGRWPKGTKKSDYGNADSGPGLPPGWLERQRQLTGKKAEDIKAEVAAAAAAGNPIDTSLPLASTIPPNGDHVEVRHNTTTNEHGGFTTTHATADDASNGVAGAGSGDADMNSRGAADVAMTDATVGPDAHQDADGEDE